MMEGTGSTAADHSAKTAQARLCLQCSSFVWTQETAFNIKTVYTTVYEEQISIYVLIKILS